MEDNKSVIKAAFPYTVPVLTGYIFMGMAFGIYLMKSTGLSAIWAFLMAVSMYAGSMQFVAVGLLVAGFNPLNAFFITLMVNARHVFYGISMLEQFKIFGKAKYYMIFSLTDETFSLLCSVKPPKGVVPQKFYFAIATMNHIYWIVGCTLGGLIGTAFEIDTQGISFVMTALFVVIFLGQWQEKRNRIPAFIGLGASFICRLLFGPQWFIMGAMALLVVLFSVGRKPIEGRMQV